MGCQLALPARPSHFPACMRASEFDNLRSNANTDAVLIAAVAMMFSLLCWVNVDCMSLRLVAVLAEIPIAIGLITPENLLKALNTMWAEPFANTVCRLHKSEWRTRIA